MRGKIVGRPVSFFARLLLSSLLIITLSVTFSLGINRYVSGILEEEISRANRASIEQLSKEIDTWIEEAFNDFALLSASADVNDAIRKDLRGGEISTIDMIKVKKALSALFNPHMDEIFLYFPKNDKVVSRTLSCFPLAQYVDCYYAGDEAFLNSVSEARVASLAALKEQRTFLVLQPLPLTNMAVDSAVGCAVISKHTLFAAMNSYVPVDGSILIADRNGNVIVSSGNMQIPENLSTLLQDEEYMVTDIEGEECIVQKVSSKYQKYSYVSVVPSRVFYERAINVRYACMIACIVFFLISSFVAYWLSRRNYRPISNLVDEIRLNAQQETPEYANEIEYIRAVLRKTLDEQAGLQDAKAASALRRMIHAQVSSGAGAQAVLEGAGLMQVSNFFSVVLMQPEQSSGDGGYQELNDSAIARLVSDIAAKEDRAWVVMENEGLYACILNTLKNDADAAVRFAQGVRAFFEGSLGLTFTLSVGGCYEGISGVRASFLEAREALAYRSVLGAGSVIASSSLEKPSFRYRFSARDEAEQLAVSAVKTGEPASDALLLCIRRKCCEGDIRLPDEFKCFSFDICALLRRTAEKLSLSGCMVDALMVCDTLPAFEISFADTIERMRSAYSEGDAGMSGRSQQMCRRIKNYIDESFGDPALGISAVGTHFEMSGAYLSRLFADTMGMTIAAYITASRIEHAKKMLKENDLSIEVISEKCGFLSSSTFIRLFKKIEGITPGSFRRMYSGEGETPEEEERPSE